MKNKAPLKGEKIKLSVSEAFELVAKRMAEYTKKYNYNTELFNTKITLIGYVVLLLFILQVVIFALILFKTL